MNDTDLQLLSSYLDGELDQVSSTRLQRRLAAEPELQQALAHMRANDEALRTAFAGTDTVPARVAAMLEPAQSNVVAFPDRRRSAAWQYAVAASLVAAAGLLLAPQWRQAESPQAGDILLSEALEVSPSRAAGWETLPDGRRLRAVLSFPDHDGNWCREFLLGDDSGDWHGVACRDDAAWTTRALAQTEVPGSADEYRPAGAGDTASVADFIATQAADIALSASEEQARIENGWQ